MNLVKPLNWLKFPLVLLMMTKVKRKIISVEPITPIANTRFKEEMDLLTSCYVEDENETQVFLCSVNKKYKFIMNKKEDKNWRIVK